MNNLYHTELKKHYSKPVGLNRIINKTHASEGYNPTCGDEINIQLQLSNQTISDISFETDSCAICTASASLLCQISQEKDIVNIKIHFQYLLSKLQSHSFDLPLNDINTEALECLLPVSAHPSRVNCALLPWQTAIEAVNNPISTTN